MALFSVGKVLACGLRTRLKVGSCVFDGQSGTELEGVGICHFHTGKHLIFV